MKIYKQLTEIFATHLDESWTPPFLQTINNKDYTLVGLRNLCLGLVKI